MNTTTSFPKEFALHISRNKMMRIILSKILLSKFWATVIMHEAMYTRTRNVTSPQLNVRKGVRVIFGAKILAGISC